SRTARRGGTAKSAKERNVFQKALRFFFGEVSLLKRYCSTTVVKKKTKNHGTEF
ncbi:MAG: RNA polymerase-interacting CarD/CdnL/TRCF family regulator, partial [Patescibacteria group bacterium]